MTPVIIICSGVQIHSKYINYYKDGSTGVIHSTLLQGRSFLIVSAEITIFKYVKGRENAPRLVIIVGNFIYILVNRSIFNKHQGRYAPSVICTLAGLTFYNNDQGWCVHASVKQSKGLCEHASFKQTRLM